MELEVLKNGFLIFMTPPTVFINGIPAFSYRLSDEEQELIAQETLKATRNYLETLYLKTLDALKRVQGELEPIGTLKVAGGVSGVQIGREKCYLIEDGVFKTSRGEVRVFFRERTPRDAVQEAVNGNRSLNSARKTT